ncbi:hypothetical protein JB92DRAFT_3098200 [Gautieria morchelliformis]|nr:hypothetical protein JB92DRAFT_3098200 [Gautieria morchelliformis]
MVHRAGNIQLFAQEEDIGAADREAYGAKLAPVKGNKTCEATLDDHLLSVWYIPRVPMNPDKTPYLSVHELHMRECNYGNSRLSSGRFGNHRLLRLRQASQVVTVSRVTLLFPLEAGAPAKPLVEDRVVIERLYNTKRGRISAGGTDPNQAPVWDHAKGEPPGIVNKQEVSYVGASISLAYFGNYHTLACKTL